MIGYILSFLLSFVTVDAFRAAADHIYHDHMNPQAVRSGDIILITNHDVGPFFQSTHPHIEHPYILISHITDESVPGSYASYLDDPKLLAWFAMNYDGYCHSKIHPIPIGLAPKNLPHGHVEALRRIQESHLPKTHLLYMNITIQTYSPERWGVFKQFAMAPFCFRTGKKPFAEYLVDMAQSQFTIAPRGAGLDTYRLWEALYVGSIPIVKTSSLDSLYEGLPIVIVNDWSEVTEPFLEQKRWEFSQRTFSFDKLDMSYWLKQIAEARSNISF